MGIKKSPSSLFNLCIKIVSKNLLQQWRNTYFSNFKDYSTEFKSIISTLIPYTIYDQIFDCMIDSHARFVQSYNSQPYKLNTIYLPNVPGLIDSIIVPHLRRLNLNCLRHIGTVRDIEIAHLEGTLWREIVYLTNLVEISLSTSGTDSTLPTCTDEILEKIGSSCPKLKSLDISYNYKITDYGVKNLVPHENHNGCPLLVKVSLFECSVTCTGVARLIDGLPQLKFLGYRETGEALLYLNKHILNETKQLELLHINNLGSSIRTCTDVSKLKCDLTMVNVISKICPKVNALKVRVDDTEVKHLKQIRSVSTLDLVYNTGRPSSPGSNSAQYFQLCGFQFTSLAFLCDTFSTQMLAIVCEQCVNLTRLWIRCNIFACDKDITTSDKQKCTLTNLKEFYFRVCNLRDLGEEPCHIPSRIFSYILNKTSELEELSLIMKNDLVCDMYIQELFLSIQTSKLKRIMILVPYKNVIVSSLNLSTVTVEVLIALCPLLEQLGNLLVWDISLEEIQELRRQLQISNSALVLTYKVMVS